MKIAAPRGRMAKRSHRTIGSPDENLRAFLTANGTDHEELAGILRDVVTDPRLVVASGSTVVGYGNRFSDLDLYAVTRTVPARGVPMVSHDLSVLTEVNYLDEAETRALLLRLFSEWSRPRRTHDTGALSSLGTIVRLALGVPLVVDREWSETLEWLKEGWLFELASLMWRRHAWCRVAAAEWLLDPSPLLSAQVSSDAALMALKAVTTDAGFVYMQRKWLATELRALGDPEVARLYTEILTVPRDRQDAARKVVRSAEIVRSTIGPPPGDGRIQLWLAPGVEVRQVANTTLVHRWEFRGVALAAPALDPHLHPSDPIWEGTPSDSPPPELLTLFRSDLVHMEFACDDCL